MPQIAEAHREIYQDYFGVKAGSFERFRCQDIDKQINLLIEQIQKGTEIDTFVEMVKDLTITYIDIVTDNYVVADYEVGQEFVSAIYNRKCTFIDPANNISKITIQELGETLKDSIKSFVKGFDTDSPEIIGKAVSEALSRLLDYWFWLNVITPEERIEFKDGFSSESITNELKTGNNPIFEVIDKSDW